MNRYTQTITAYEALLMLRFSDLRRYPWLTALFVGFSRLGDGPLWWGIAALLLVFGDTHGRWGIVLEAIVIGISVLLFMALKKLTGRPRPFEVWGDLPCLMAPPDRFSFPSGHTMTAFAVYSLFSAWLPAVGAGLLPPAILIALSRVFLGLHYPTDIVVGGALGTVIGLGVACLAAGVCP